MDAAQIQIASSAKFLRGYLDKATHLKYGILNELHASPVAKRYVPLACAATVLNAARISNKLAYSDALTFGSLMLIQGGLDWASEVSISTESISLGDFRHFFDAVLPEVGLPSFSAEEVRIFGDLISSRTTLSNDLIKNETNQDFFLIANLPGADDISAYAPIVGIDEATEKILLLSSESEIESQRNGSQKVS